MEDVLAGLGVVALAVLAVVGLVVGWAIGAATRGNKFLFAATGAVAAVATPFLLLALGVTALAAGGLLVVALVGLVGALVVVGAVRALTGRR